MSDQADDVQEARPVTVAELLARNGTQPGSRAHRRRARKGGISVAELTGEIPVIRDEPFDEPGVDEHPADGHDAAQTESAAEAEPAAAGQAGRHGEADVDGAADEADSEEPAAERAGTRHETADPGTQAFTPPWVRGDDAETSSVQPQVGLLTTGSAAAELMRAEHDAAEQDAAERSAAEHDGTEYAAAEHDGTELDGTEPAEADAEVEGKPRGALKQWAVIGLQCVVAIIVGALLFKGFEKLWDVLPWVALVLAVLVVLGLVALVRILRKTDDILSILIAVIVGLIVTLGPLAFLLSTR